MNHLAIVFIISLIIVFIMIKQINSVTKKIDQKEAVHKPSLYSKFASIIQENVRLMKTDIDHTKATSTPVYILKNKEDEERSLEFLADTIRKLVFFETMNSNRRDQKDIESELFLVLNKIEKFLEQKVVNGEALADKLRDKLFQNFQSLQNE